MHQFSGIISFRIVNRMIKQILVLICSFLIYAQAYSDTTIANDKKMLSSRFNESELSRLLIEKDSFCNLLFNSYVKQMISIPTEVKEVIIQKAENLMFDDDPLPASLFLEYIKNGNRKNFEEKSFARRNKLSILVVAEKIENKNRFTNNIINLIWSICEESFWGVPAHLYMQKAGLGLPDVEEPIVDLFAAETGSCLAWTYFLLKEKLDSISPIISRRIEYEIKRRILDPCNERNDFWWMGFNSERPLNNWTPWICSNWLTCILFIENNSERRIRSVLRSMQIVDRFIDSYPDDGGCDEGPSYYWRAAASALEYLELLYIATGKNIDIFHQPKIKEMGRYICYSYIAYPYFTNFGDASAIPGVSPVLLYRLGSMLEDADIKKMAVFFFQKNGAGPNLLLNGNLGRLVPNIVTFKELTHQDAQEPLFKSVWLPNTEFLAIREHANSVKGFYMAIKGGHNGVSHNHNDVGNFILFYDGKPVFVDAGVETYTAKTFSKNRYEIWTMQSAYHNLPTINGVDQNDGKSFRSKDVWFRDLGTKYEFNIDISSAYPDSACVKKWTRSVIFEPEKQISIHERYILVRKKRPTVLHLLTPISPENIDNNSMRFILRQYSDSEKDKSKSVNLHYDHDKFSKISIDTITIEDIQLKRVWGDKLYRINFFIKSDKLRNECVFRVNDSN